MVVAFMANIHAFQIKWSGQPCDHSDGATVVAALLAFAYFLLFSNFFYNSYIRKGQKRPVIQQKKVE